MYGTNHYSNTELKSINVYKQTTRKENGVNNSTANIKDRIRYVAIKVQILKKKYLKKSVARCNEITKTWKNRCTDYF